MCSEKHSPAATTEGHHVELRVAPFRPENIILLTTLSFFGFWPAELEADRWGSVMEDALPQQKCFVTSQTVASSPMLLFPLKNKQQLLLRHMEFCIRSFVNKLFSFLSLRSFLWTGGGVFYVSFLVKLLVQHWEHFILWQPLIQTPSLTDVIL